jgi:hypothetical protein
VALILNRHVSPQFHVAFDPSFRTVKEDKFNQLWQLKAGFIVTRKEASTGTSKESIYPKRPTPEPEGASQQPKKRGKKQMLDSPDKHGKTPDTPQREGGKLQQPPDDSHSRQQRLLSPTHPVGQADGKSSSMSSPEDPLGSQQVDSRQIHYPARANSNTMETMVRAGEAELSKATVRKIEGELFSFQAMFQAYAGFLEEHPILAYKATSDPDTMYHHQAMW